MKLTQVSFSASQYIAEEHPKKQIYIHHTAGSADPFAVFKVWENNPEKIATCVTVGGKPTKTAKWIDGEVVQGFSSKLWAYHLGLKESTFQKFGLPYKSLDKISIGIEVCNFGGLTYKEGRFYTYVNSTIPEEDVVALPKEYKGYKYVHAYTDAQIQAIKELLLLWKEKYNIPLTYNEDIWDVTPRALKGDSGIFTHNSVRYDKIDVTPQPKLIEMLKSL